MTGDRSKALAPQPSTGLASVSRLAERTLAERATRSATPDTMPQADVVVAADGSGDATTIADGLRLAATLTLPRPARIRVRRGEYRGGFEISLPVELVGEAQLHENGGISYPAILLRPENPVEVSASSGGISQVAFVDEGFWEAVKADTPPWDRDPPEEPDDDVGWEERTLDERARPIVRVTSGSVVFERVRLLQGYLWAFVVAGSTARPYFRHFESDPDWWGWGTEFMVTDGAQPSFDSSVINWGITFQGERTGGFVRNCDLGDVYVGDLASPTIEDCRIDEHAQAGVFVASGKPLFRRNRIGRVFHDDRASVTIRGGAPRFLDNEIGGECTPYMPRPAILVDGQAATPLFRHNRISLPAQRDSIVDTVFDVRHFAMGADGAQHELTGPPPRGPAIIARGGSSPRFSGNVIEGSVLAEGPRTSIVLRDSLGLGGLSPVLLDGAKATLSHEPSPERAST